MGYWRAVAFILCLVSVLLLAVSHADYDVGYYINDDYGIDSDCTGNDLINWEILQDYRYEMFYRGWSNLHWITIYDFRLVDPDSYDWGQDYNYVDSHDITWITGHGRILSDRYQQIKLHTNYHLGCYITPEFHMQLGEFGRDIEILHVKSCHSMDESHDIWRNWRPVFKGVHQIHGFHGLSWSAMKLREPLENLAINSHSSAVALEWKDELHQWIYDSDNEEWVEQCPVAYTGRETLVDADRILDNERYPTPGQVNIVFGDVYSPSKWRRRYVDGCDPADGGPM